MIFQNLWNEVMLDFTKRVCEILKCNDHRALFYPGFVDDMCHLSSFISFHFKYFRRVALQQYRFSRGPP